MKVICARVQRVMQEGTLPASEGICPQFCRGLFFGSKEDVQRTNKGGFFSVLFSTDPS